MPSRIRQRRILTNRKRSRPVQQPIVAVRSPKKRKKWTKEQMVKAMEAVRSGSGINRAALDYGVPHTTLKDRLSGRVKDGVLPGPEPYLASEEEKELATFLVDCAAVGFGKTRREVMGIVEQVILEKEAAEKRKILRAEKISDGWWRRFQKRQKELSLRRGDNTSHLRMDAVNGDTMKQYFDLLEDVLTEHNLKDLPSQIYNMDESGMPLDPKALNVVTKRGVKKVRSRSTGQKGQITIVACGSAVSQVIPPMVIFDAKKLCYAWTANEVTGTSYGLSDSGWITTPLFEGWLTDHFLTHAVPGRPLLLLLDGHSTHYQPEVVRFAKEKNIIMLCLPPHTTHEAQPLDCSVFSALKSRWRTVCHKFIRSNPHKTITKFNFAVTPANVMAGFKVCGVYPFDRSAIKIHPKPVDKKDCQREKVVVACKRIRVSDGEERNDASSNDSAKQQSDAESSPVEFSVEQEELFQRRFNEGYNLFIDPNYVGWLTINHPEALPDSAPTNNYGDSLIAHFSDVTPETPLEVIEQDSSHVTPETPLEVTEQDSSHVTPETPLEVTEQGMLNFALIV